MLEAAVAVAREGERSTPPHPAPPTLRRYLSFARLPDPALEVARRVLDDDESFRARVADAVDEDVVGRAGWIFLTRPDGWKAEVDGLRKEAATLQLAAREDRAEREALRKLAGAEAAAARGEAAAVAANAEAERLRVELDDERARNDVVREAFERLQADVDRLGQERGVAIRRMKESEALAAQRTAELRELRHELRMVQAELGQAAMEGASSSRPAPRPAAAPAPAAASGAAPVPEDRVPASEPPLDRQAMAAAVADAARAAEQLSGALAAASRLVSPAAPDEDVAPPGSPPSAPHRSRRRPLALPPAVFDDSPAAAEHLVRTAGALLLVDGYNISNAQWHGMPPADQRTRLLDACAELHARCGADVEVVFDGTGDEPSGGSQVRASVRYRFTPAGIEADDVILARVEEEPPARPVVVASSDRRVRDGARGRGANVIGARQLLAVLRR